MAAPVEHALASLRPEQVDLFWTKVERRSDADCWHWCGSIHPNGYGTWTINLGAGRTTSVRPHRVAWFLTRGTIPAGLTIDHLCHNRICCNPMHLEPVTQAVNTARQVPRVRHESRAASVRERRTRDGVVYAVLFRRDGRQSSRTFPDRAEAERLVGWIRTYGVSAADSYGSGAGTPRDAYVLSSVDQGC